MKLNSLMAAGMGLGFTLMWATPTLAAMTEDKNFGLEVKITGQAEDDRDLGTRSGGDVNGIGLDVRPWIYGERGNFSGYAMGQVVTATDTIQTDPLEQATSDGSGTQTARGNASEREVDKSYLALREFWIGYSGFTPYPGEMLKVGRQRLRNDDGQWHDVNIEAVNWAFDTTLLRADVGAAQRFSEYRTDLTELDPKDKDRQHLFGDVAYQWSPGHWAGVRAHHSHDGGSLKDRGEVVDDLDKTSRGDLTWLGLQANSDAYNYRNTNPINYWGSLTYLTGDRDETPTTFSSATDQYLAGDKTSSNVNGWATDLGLRFRLDPQWQVGAAYSRASKNYEQNGLESNRSNWTGTRSRVHRFGEAFQGEMANVETGSLFASWQLRDDYDASLIYHKFRRVDGNARIGGAGVNPNRENFDENGISTNTFDSLPLEDGRKDLGQEMDLVVTKYFKQGLLPAALSQSMDEPSALVRLRAGVFKPGDAYHSGVDEYMHRAIVDVIWRF
ncbi:alginate biosynthesis protein AlgE [Pseudomonas sp. CFII64]|uniref:alginate export family protein n=1 Tax=Pseudomonas sp. CFII64 TaxID=911242 RepID=UPI000356EE86|nr:alginate export family protein [Pseudomonas sp. CFII64]EPJ75493.1 alginate biosynthesis protein AlgE [Pseudomonas sp. CFII64]